MIKLFESTATSYTTNGLGTLSEAVSCTVTEELNGIFELDVSYPITGKRYADLLLRQIIVAKPNPYSTPQPFRIYSISKPIKGIVTVKAEHISYDLTGYPVQPFTAADVATAFVNLSNASVLETPFTFTTDKAVAADLAVIKPTSIRSVLGGSGSILELYGGEYEFDNYAVRLLEQRGTNRGVSIRYGKNLTDLKQEENCSSVYTAVYPYWYKDDEETPILMQLPEIYLHAPGTYTFARIYTLDLSSEFEEQPTEEELRIKATYYMQVNGIGLPQVSLSVSFVQLSQSPEYKNFALLERVYLGDTVNVDFPKLKVSSIARCIKTIYNAITDKYDKIELGHALSKLSTTISNTINEQNQLANKVPTKSFVQAAIENATKLITGGLGGHVVLHSSSGGPNPDEILVMDEEDIINANNVWRWNVGGLGHSSTGYNGPYSLAMTMDGAIVAGMITSGKIQASQLEAGSITTNELSFVYKESVTSEITNKIEALEDGFTLSSENSQSGDSSLITLKSGGITIASANVNFPGLVTFGDLSTSGLTSINGDNVNTGKISASFIGANANYLNGQFTAITFSSPILLDSQYPDISGIDNLYFGAVGQYPTLITDQDPGYEDYLTLRSYYGVRIPYDSGLYVKKIFNNGNMSIDTCDNMYGNTLYIATRKVSANNSYAVAEDVVIGNDDGTSEITLYGTLMHNGYAVLDSSNISSYVVFQ